MNKKKKETRLNSVAETVVKALKYHIIVGLAAVDANFRLHMCDLFVP